MTRTSKKSQTYNHLKNETSPYLQQHATNPVNWYPWGPQPFTKAHQENKPIFLSIGYSTCHWCHVMAHESFEDPEIAHLLNKHFINIKVDREERPDIDHIYMNICNLMTGSGGWPLTIIMTPDKHPFFAATYLPKHTRYGQVGLSTLLPHISNLWKHQKPDLLKNAQQSINALQQLNTPSQTKTLTNTILEDTYQHLLTNFDPQHGGFSLAPKFPTPHHLIYLLRYGHHTNTLYAHKMVETTLEHMRLGGIYDHIGYGFHRYATDPTWLVPHFEKMLYDQALLSYTYNEAYHATHNSLFKQTSQEILKYVTKTLTDPHGGFYSAEDADSEGTEGKFYTWTYNELQKHLTQSDLKFLQHFYNITKEGNYLSEQTRTHDTTNILHQTQTLTDYAKYTKQDEKTLKQQQKNLQQKLYAIREKRLHPHKDTKILTDWNGLMIAAFAQAARIHQQPAYTKYAEKALHFILSTMKQPNYELYHSYHHGKKQHTGYADDYVFIIWGLLELYQTTFNTRFLEDALHLNDYLFTHFWDQKNHGLYFYSDIGEKLIIRDKQSYDGAYPSSNSIHLNNLQKLYAITADPSLNEKASQLINTFSGDIHRLPSGYTYMLNSMLPIFHQSTEIVIVGEKTDKTTQRTLEQMSSKYLPSATIIYKDPSTTDETLEKIAPYLSEYHMKNKKTTIYVCQNHQCKQPITNVDEALQMLHN